MSAQRRRIATGLLALGFVVAWPTAGMAQTGEDLFQQALLLERTSGDLAAAISLYTRIVDEHGENRVLAARALLQVGRAHERLGRAEARAAYERLIVEYADQAELALEARRRLRALEVPPAAQAPAAPLEISSRKVADLDARSAPSPDGRYLSFVDWETGNLALFDLDTMQREPLTGDASLEFGDTAFADRSVWSPDGRRIAYLWFRRGPADGAILAELRLVERASGRIHTLVGPSRDASLTPMAWTADGSAILALRQSRISPASPHVDEIVLVDSRSGSLRTVLRLPQGQHSHAMDISPDGRFVAYVLHEDERTERNVYVMTVDASLHRRLMPPGGDTWAPMWSPDGGSLLFAWNPLGGPTLYSVEMAAGSMVGAPRIALRGVGPGFRPLGFSQDGTLFHATSRLVHDVFVMPLDSTGVVEVRDEWVSPAGGGRAPMWSPDGARLAYLSNRGDRVFVVIQDRASGYEVEYALESSRVEATTADYNYPQWAPGGDHILVSLQPHGTVEPSTYLLDVRTGGIELLFAGAAEHPLWKTFSPDGTHLYFVRDSTIIEHDLETQSERAIRHTTRDVIGLALSPDGQQLAYFEYDPASSWKIRDLVVTAVADGATRILWRTDGDAAFPRASAPMWTPDGRQLVVAAGGTVPMLARHVQFFRVDLLSGEATPVSGPLHGLRYPFDARLHPSGTELATMRGTEPNEIWRITNLLGPVP